MTSCNDCRRSRDMISQVWHVTLAAFTLDVACDWPVGSDDISAAALLLACCVTHSRMTMASAMQPAPGRL